jgi:hypothetical protein
MLMFAADAVENGCCLRRSPRYDPLIAERPGNAQLSSPDGVERCGEPRDLRAAGWSCTPLTLSPLILPGAVVLAYLNTAGNGFCIDLGEAALGARGAADVLQIMAVRVQRPRR